MRRPVILIQDGAIDEYVSMAILATHPEVDLRGVILVNADCIAAPAMDVAAKILAFLDRPEVPVGLSACRFFNPFPWEYRSDCVALNNIEPLKPFDRPVTWPPYPDGDELLRRLVRTSNVEVDLITTSPLTPVTQAFAVEPTIALNIRSITWMGGAIEVQGNLDPKTIPTPPHNARAEWNAFCDAYAVDQLMATYPGRLIIYPLDVTKSAKVTPEFVNALRQAAKAGSRLARLSAAAYELVANEPFYELWDVTTTCGWLRPELFAGTEAAVTVETNLLGDYGAMSLAPGNANVRQAMVKMKLAVSLDDFYRYVVAQLSRDARELK